jgi:hypothetical protein
MNPRLIALNQLTPAWGARIASQDVNRVLVEMKLAQNLVANKTCGTCNEHLHGRRWLNPATMRSNIPLGRDRSAALRQEMNLSR